MCVEITQEKENKCLPCFPSLVGLQATGEAREGQVQGQKRIASIVPACNMEDIAEFVSTV